MCCVEVYTIHHWAQFFLSRSKDSAVDVFRQLTTLDYYFVGIVINALWLWEIVGRLDWQCKMSIKI